MAKPKNTVTEFRSYLLPVDFPVVILTGDVWRISDRPAKNLHFHNCLEIGICHEGSGYLMLGSEKLFFSGGDMTIIAGSYPHTTCSTQDTASLWSYLYTDPAELLGSFAPAWSASLSALFQRLNTAALLPADSCADAAFLMNRILRTILAKGENYELSACTDILSLLLEIDRINKKEPDIAAPNTTSSSPALTIMPALEYIRTNYMSTFTVDDLATRCGLSPTHFRRLFHQAMDTSPLEFLNGVRISKACHMLRSSEESILNISENVGFRSISSFNRYFARIIGMSPREYRRADSSDEGVKRSTIMHYTGWLVPEK